MHLSATGKGKPGPNSGISSTVPNLSYLAGAIHKGCPHIRGVRGSGTIGQIRAGGMGVVN